MVKDAAVNVSEAQSPKTGLKMKNTYDSNVNASDDFEPTDAFDKRQISPALSQPRSEIEPDLEEEPQNKEPEWDAWRLSDSIPDDELDMESLLANTGMASMFPFGQMPMDHPPWMPMFMPTMPMLPMPGMGSFPNLTSSTPKDSTAVRTVMMRNLPNKYTQQMLLEEINLAGFAGTFDFFYLPIDPETDANRGYAFINFENPINAHYFMAMFEGRQMYRFDSKKFVSCMPATLQGFDANYSHYANTRVSRGDLATRPLFLRQPTPQAAVPASAIRGTKRRGRRHGTNGVEEANRRSEETYIGAPPGQLNAPVSTPTLPRPPAKDPMAQPMHVENIKDSTKRFCGACGGKRMPDYKFCQFCGAAL